MIQQLARRMVTRLRPRPRPVSAVEARMRQHWDERARENALYYIVTGAAESEEQFAASGEKSVSDILADVQHLVPAEGTVLEIGCGIGRMLRPLASRSDPRTAWMSRPR